MDSRPLIGSWPLKIRDRFRRYVFRSQPSDSASEAEDMPMRELSRIEGNGMDASMGGEGNPPTLTVVSHVLSDNASNGGPAGGVGVGSAGQGPAAGSAGAVAGPRQRDDEAPDRVVRSSTVDLRYKRIGKASMGVALLFFATAVTLHVNGPVKAERQAAPLLHTLFLVMTYAAGTILLLLFLCTEPGPCLAAAQVGATIAGLAFILADVVVFKPIGKG